MMLHLEYPEGATPIGLGEAKGLILTHITTRRELDRWEEENIIETLTWLDRTKPIGILNEQFVKELHRRMFVNVWKWAGHFRLIDKNIGEAWFQIPAGLKNLCDDTRCRIELHKEKPDEIAIHFHHRLVLIHPFPNGNGRHARLMTDILLENILNCPKFTWGSANLSKVGETRLRYIAALHAADNRNYQPLREFVRT